MDLAAYWTTYDVPDRQIAVARWEQRGLSVVFPIGWAQDRGQAAMIAHAKNRVADVEGKTGLRLISGSVLLAFARDDESLPRKLAFAPEVPRGIH